MKKYLLPLGLGFAFSVACSGTGSSGANSGGTTSGGTGSALSATGGGDPSASGGSSAGSGSSSSSGTGASASATGGTGNIDSGTLTWKQANMTNYTSYPDPGSEECVKYNGCEWSGYFAALPDQQTKEWVEAHNIVAFFSAGDDNAGYSTYELKTLRLRKDGKEIDVTVYDTCGDSDCSGCCTTNATQNGLATLIDVESFTAARFGVGDGIVEWACLDCTN